MMDTRNQIHWNFSSNDAVILNFELSVTTSNYIDWILKIIDDDKFATCILQISCRKEENKYFVVSVQI